MHCSDGVPSRAGKAGYLQPGELVQVLEHSRPEGRDAVVAEISTDSKRE